MEMDTPNNIFYSRYYKANRILLSLLGLWPFQSDRYKRVMLVTVTIINMTQIFTKVLALVALRNDFDAIIECVPPLIIDATCIVKQTNLISNMEKIRILFMHIQKDWQSQATTHEFKILHQYAEKGRSITIGYASGIYVFGSLVSLMPIVPKLLGTNAVSNYTTKPIGLPYHVKYYVDLEKYFYVVLIHNYLAAYIRLTTIIAFDTCLVILVQHCCGLFSVVRYRLENIRKSIEQDKKLALLEEADKFYENFVYCICKHEDALQFAKTLETVYTNALFIEVGLIIMAMSSSALQATSGTLTLHLAIRHGGYIICQLMHLFIACWLGQQIIDHSEHVYTAIYNGEWYEASSKSTKLLNMIMLRSITPCALTIGKIMILSLPTFSAVVRISASYFTVMQSIH